MESVRQEVGPHPRVHITSIDGDLRVSGRPGTRLEAQAGSRGGLLVQARGNGVEVTCRSGCLLFLPEDSTLEVERVSGDARLADLAGELRLGDIAGDLSLRHVGATHVEHVSGDLAVRRLVSGLRVAIVDGSARMEQVTGPVHIDQVAGDLRAIHLEGGLQVHARGDAMLEWLPPAGSSSSVRAEGDVVCRFLTSASARVTGRAQGDLRMMGERSAGESTVTLGGGEATVEISAGGDVLVTHGGTEFTAGLAEEISSQVEATLADVEAGLEGMDLSAYGLEAQDLRQKVHRAISRALRRARQGSPETAEEETVGAEPTDDERLAILRMLEDGKISVEQAESLLRALEPGA
ncbi:MAG TPA: hypothetical protein VFI11_12160 [Anaerolineales bacterium]|nr:hypothetical protein [Anaerolineales bacterium]